ncbi:MAG TPA: FlgD immunoglobulin-like domain containing protein [Thermoanaerobaculia bacterium]|jgi:flagellar hook assembly protein FlgD|nr:FlgD immunoglobulin-like domain containing protein [Thermoanaerobaculia bacterium]
MKARDVAFALLLAPVAASAQSLSISPQQGYVIECGETFVTLTGTNLTGTASTLVDFTTGSQVYELPPNIATSTSLQVWIPLEVTSSVGTYSVTVKATDTGSGTRMIGPATFTVVARSANAPPLPPTLPEAIVVDATSSSGAYVSFDAGGASCDHASGSQFPVGTTTVTCTVVNAYGTTTESFSIVVNATFGAPPTLSIPEIVVAEATWPTGAVVTWNANGATCNYASGSQFPMGNTTVTCSMTNSYGTSTGSFTIVVTDTTRPSLSLPANITSSSQVVTYTASATDNIDGSIPINCNPVSGTTFPYGTNVVQCSATDAHLNTATGSFIVTITPPDLTGFTASQSVYQINTATGESVTYTSNVTVSCNETLTIQSVLTGQTVRTLLNNVPRTGGTYQDMWDGKNDAGQPVPDGPYQYVVVVSAAGNSFSWNDNTHYIGTQASQKPYPSCRDDSGTLGSCTAATLTFDPYTNKPLRIDYCIPALDPGSTDPQCLAGNVPAIIIAKATPSAETDAVCRGTDCFLYDYQSSGSHEITWWGRSIDGTFIGANLGITIIRRTDIWPKNVVLLYGSAPVVSSLAFSTAVFNPASAPSPLAVGEAITITITSPMSRQIGVTAQFRNTTSGSILRTVTTPLQNGSSFQIDWDGRADNGAWVAPGLYEVIITATDSAGSSTVLKPLMTVRYE